MKDHFKPIIDDLEASPEGEAKAAALKSVSVLRYLYDRATTGGGISVQGGGAGSGSGGPPPNGGG